MKCAIELNTVKEVEKFTDIVSRVEADVWLVGNDEHGNPWYLSAKSLLGSLLLSANMQKKRKHTAHDVDWNTIFCVCEQDIYCLIREFAKG